MTHQRESQRGFTLIEVLIALSMVAGTLVVMLVLTSSSIRDTQMSMMRGVVVDLARGKMFDIEALLLKDGFQELDQSDEGDFSEEGWPAVKWETKIEKIELPALSALGALGGEGEASADPEAGESALAASPLGGLLGGFGVDPGQLGEAGVIASQFQLISQVLEASIRKVTLTVTWNVGNEEDQMVVACYFTDPKSMNKVIQTGGIPDEGSDQDSDQDSGQGRGQDSGQRGIQRGGGNGR